ncbi:EAL domain-containing protein [Kluyvera genomosp. 1]|uniref:sensor domain-containing phosphodiesterase n=1 Tax=Kluyvera genomosp. 1 TaxID=2774053 RepID=UPI00068F0D7B|nr:EAL domain-containing protein [Kluyvera genomosp. 1]
MNFCKCYKQYRDRWWGLPLVLPLLILPIIKNANTYTYVGGGKTYLYYLPLPFLLCMMLFFGWKALPGLIAGVSCFLTRDLSTAEEIGITLQFLIPTLVAWGGYQYFNDGRRMISHGDTRLMANRLLWQMFVPASLFMCLIQFTLYIGVYPSLSDVQLASPLTERNLINYQSLLMGYLTGVPLCYLLIRLIRNPYYIRGFISQVRLDFDPKVKWPEMLVWGAVVLGIFSMLMVPLNNTSTIFSTNYTISLLLPVMLWGSMRFGYRFISIVWTLMLIVAIHYHHHFVPHNADYSTQLAITSSSFLIFSFIIAYMAMLSSRQRAIHERVRRMAFIDPVVNLPNMRALSRAINKTPWSVLCFLRMPDLEILARHYGIMLRINYKQNLAEYLRDVLRPGEGVYQLTGSDLAVKLHTESYKERIDELYARLKMFRYSWNGMPLQPQIGLSYCYIQAPIAHLPLMLGELNTVAELSLVTDRPENMQRRGAQHLQQELKGKIAMMVRVQQALETDGFRLMAQPIVGTRGDDYHEVLLRMLGDDGELISPALFLPVAHEFGMASRIDLWVLEHTLRFMASRRDSHPGLRLAVNLSPSTASGLGFARKVGLLLNEYSIEAWQLVFEITESHSLVNVEQARQTLRELQELGCRVAIDDFGTGYASYARLKHISADILKIDGSFIRNIATSSLDYQIVSSICHLARMKKMRLVAEFVENEEIRTAAIALGIDYLQGYAIGKPAPLEELAMPEREVKVSSGDHFVGRTLLSDF